MAASWVWMSDLLPMGGQNRGQGAPALLVDLLPFLAHHRIEGR